MGLVGQIGVAQLGVFEGHQEAMREAFGAAFRTDVGAVFEGGDPVDFLRQRLKAGDDLLDLLFRGVAFEFEEDDVPQRRKCRLERWRRDDS